MRIVPTCPVVATAISILSVVSPSLSYAQPLTHASLKKICRDGVRKHTLPYTEVRIRMGPGFISDNLHSVIPPMGVTIPDHPIAVLRSTQVGIEALRLFSEQSDSRTRFWSSHLRAADSKVALSLRKVQQGNLSPEEKLKTAQATLRTVYRIFDDAIAKYAADTGRRRSQLATLPAMISFQVVTKPKDANVEILLLGDYLALREQNASRVAIDSSLMWRPLSKPSAREYGIYYYRLVTGENQRQPFDKNRIVFITHSPSNGRFVFK